MNNFKKVALGLAISGLAVGFSAFRTAEQKKESLANFYYVLTSPGIYTKAPGSSMPDLERCANEVPHPCVISFASDQGSNPLNANSLPATPNYQSSEKGLWQ
ncbi:hypothetical protein E6C50_01990 [Flavobacterium supellecticarium]|uniref:Uncharacterized protein n=1 Tax=Flavobacterium supellecticarium TaxID=2565924 RepID=A0A4S4A3L1_9FLAO|nr:hypothetical protein [Flavobacterium supellecticarium]THF53002.1 hypothetical protein E6C50_01990 [Flavobacterium supellecticarium]